MAVAVERSTTAGRVAAGEIREQGAARRLLLPLAGKTRPAAPAADLLSNAKRCDGMSRAEEYVAFEA